MHLLRTCDKVLLSNSLFVHCHLLKDRTCLQYTSLDPNEDNLPDIWSRSLPLVKDLLIRRSLGVLRARTESLCFVDQIHVPFEVTRSSRERPQIHLRVRFCPFLALSSSPPSMFARSHGVQRAVPARNLTRAGESLCAPGSSTREETTVQQRVCRWCDSKLTVACPSTTREKKIDNHRIGTSCISLFSLHSERSSVRRGVIESWIGMRSRYVQGPREMTRVERSSGEGFERKSWSPQCLSPSLSFPLRVRT